MGSGICFPISAIPIITIILITFNIKEHVDNDETKIFNILCILNFIGLIIEISCTYACKIYGIYRILSAFVLKTYLVYLIIWTATLATYIYKISKVKTNKIFKYIHRITLSVMLLIIYMLPINVIMDEVNKIHYTEGLSVTFSYIISFVYVIFILIVIIKNAKNIKVKKCLPVYLFFVIGTIAIIIQKSNPQYLLLTYAQTLICLCMYFTIENPDVKLMEKMEFARDEAEKANRAKSDFLSSMSHEIRTPLNAILGLSEDIASYNDLVPKEVVEDSNDIINASQTLLEIVGNILDLNKIEANKMEIINNPYNLKDEVIKLCKITKTRIGDKKIKFNLNIADDIPYSLNGDKGKVKEIINNLLTNAIKYTEKGEINLNIKCINNNQKKISNIIITCQDTGKGIKKEHIERLFKRFDRLDVERNTTTEGTGLGLAITKALVEMMHGKINVESRYGKGSIFMVQIPQKIDAVDKVEEKVKEEKRNITYKGKKILIVDDNALNIKVARKALTDFEFDIDECFNGKEAIEKVNNNSYDLILMDIMMPVMNGEEALKELLKIDNFNTPVIALTADALTGSKNKYKDEGFNDYIAKPFTREHIKEKIDNIFMQREEK